MVGMWSVHGWYVVVMYSVKVVSNIFLKLQTSINFEKRGHIALERRPFFEVGRIKYYIML